MKIIHEIEVDAAEYDREPVKKHVEIWWDFEDRVEEQPPPAGDLGQQPPHAIYYWDFGQWRPRSWRRSEPGRVETLGTYSGDPGQWRSWARIDEDRGGVRRHRRELERTWSRSGGGQDV
jgi:hypothetical protein